MGRKPGIACHNIFNDKASENCLDSLIPARMNLLDEFAWWKWDESGLWSGLYG